MEPLLFGLFIAWVWSITRSTDARLRVAGEDTPAPEWARWLFVLVVAGVLFGCLGSGLAGAILAAIR